MTAYLVTLATGEQVSRLDLVPSPGEELVSHVEIPRLLGSFERWTGETIVDDLPALRADRWAAVKAARDRAEWAGCDTALGRVDTDPESQRKVNGAVTMAMLANLTAQPFTMTWTMQDNSNVLHDGPAMIAMGVMVGYHVDACQASATARRAALDAAETAQAIAAVDIEGDWPGA